MSGVPFGFSAVAHSLDGCAVALSVRLDANAYNFCGIPNRRLAGSLQHELRQPGKPWILAAARGSRNLTPNSRLTPDSRLGRISVFRNGMFSTPAVH